MGSAAVPSATGGLPPPRAESVAPGNSPRAASAPDGAASASIGPLGNAVVGSLPMASEIRAVVDSSDPIDTSCRAAGDMCSVSSSMTSSPLFAV